MVKGEIPENYYGDRKLLPAGSKTGRQEKSNYTLRYTYIPKRMTVYVHWKTCK